ncbi:MAG: bifunctional adenosylcobinamide kinase/adenosylcobinamide-phosphate guanylyltransferase [Acidobacteria bacterium]|nr:MAG: bifunctional adenosylcobinamide kinase/adenosylcobinamide-phosphate guanylyltransferase [Acidobacteriota bacterium]
MSRVTLITGGARSGKSRYALQLAEKYDNRVFIATAEPIDDEMASRIAKHRAERQGAYRTVEESVELPQAIASLNGEVEVAVVDCLTVWLGNLFYKVNDEEKIGLYIDELVSSVQKCPNDLVFISNEVGLGIVPHDPSTRLYRDTVGRLNQRVAEIADTVLFMVSGLPMVLKDARGKK